MSQMLFINKDVKDFFISSCTCAWRMNPVYPVPFNVSSWF